MTDISTASPVSSGSFPSQVLSTKPPSTEEPLSVYTPDFILTQNNWGIGIATVDSKGKAASTRTAFSSASSAASCAASSAASSTASGTSTESAESDAPLMKYQKTSETTANIEFRCKTQYSFIFRNTAARRGDVRIWMDGIQKEGFIVNANEQWNCYHFFQKGNFVAISNKGGQAVDLGVVADARHGTVLVRCRLEKDSASPFCTSSTPASPKAASIEWVHRAALAPVGSEVPSKIQLEDAVLLTDWVEKSYQMKQPKTIPPTSASSTPSSPKLFFRQSRRVRRVPLLDKAQELVRDIAEWTKTGLTKSDAVLDEAEVEALTAGAHRPAAAVETVAHLREVSGPAEIPVETPVGDTPGDISVRDTAEELDEIPDAIDASATSYAALIDVKRAMHKSMENVLERGSKHEEPSRPEKRGPRKMAGKMQGKHCRGKHSGRPLSFMGATLKVSAVHDLSLSTSRQENKRDNTEVAASNCDRAVTVFEGPVRDDLSVISGFIDWEEEEVTFTLNLFISKTDR